MKSDIRPYTRQFYRGNIGLLILRLFAALLVTAAQLMISWILQQVIDLITGIDTGFTLAQMAMLTVGCLVLLWLAYGCIYFSGPRFISRALAQYKNFAFEKLSKKGISAFSGENTALYVSALSNDAATIETGYIANLFTVIENLLIFAGALVMMFWYDVTLAIISIALAILPLLASILTGNVLAKAEKQVSDRNEDFMSTLRDSLGGFSVIKSFRAELRMCRIFAQKVHEVADAKCFRQKMTILVELLSNTAGVIVQFGVFLIGAYLALSGKAVSAGSVLVFVQLLNYVISPIGVVPKCLAERKAARALIEKLANALDENVREEGSEDKHELNEAIEVSGLSFGYEEGKRVLKNIDLRFEKGKRYALVGASGSGKSTLLNLLMASHADYEGEIMYDDVPLDKISGRALYDMVSVVQQSVFIFNASIRDNITMFADFSKEEVDRAIMLSGLSEMIAQRGEDYMCGENGCGLSGGEKQRISIARSLLKNSQVLLIDEATAALDAETAYRVTDAVLNLDGITRIVVTHDLERPLLERYDEIIVLKNGSVVEQGNFESLMAKREYFYSLFTVAQ